MLLTFKQESGYLYNPYLICVEYIIFKLTFHFYGQMFDNVLKRGFCIFIAFAAIVNCPHIKMCIFVKNYQNQFRIGNVRLGRWRLA